MRTVLFFILISAFVSCGYTSSPEFKKQAPDTTLTTIEYAHNWAFNDYRTVTAEKIVLDTFTLVHVDSMTQTKKWVRDSMYLIQLVDTAKNDKGGILLDSLGKVKMQSKIYIVDKQFVLQDFNNKWGGK